MSYRPERALELRAFARSNGWDAVVDEEDDHADLQATTRFVHPDTGVGWELGVALRWYEHLGARGRRSWRLAELDGRKGRVAGGVARRLEPERVLVQEGYGGRYVDRPVELEFWLANLGVLRNYLEDPALLAAWLDEELTKEGSTP